jgi:hypothetical protein
MECAAADRTCKFMRQRQFALQASAQSSWIAGQYNWIFTFSHEEFFLCQPRRTMARATELAITFSREDQGG